METLLEFEEACVRRLKQKVQNYYKQASDIQDILFNQVTPNRAVIKEQIKLLAQVDQDEVSLRYKALPCVFPKRKMEDKPIILASYLRHKFTQMSDRGSSMDFVGTPKQSRPMSISRQKFKVKIPKRINITKKTSLSIDCHALTLQPKYYSQIPRMKAKQKSCYINKTSAWSKTQQRPLSAPPSIFQTPTSFQFTQTFHHARITPTPKSLNNTAQKFYSNKYREAIRSRQNPIYFVKFKAQQRKQKQ